MRIFLLVIILFSSTWAEAQSVPDTAIGVGSSIDSLAVMRNSLDSLLRMDSIRTAIEEAIPVHQLASMREIDVTNDGVPEVLRISGRIRKPLGKTIFDFTIKQGKKILYKDSWPADGYFAKRDSLSERMKMRRLKRTINSFFANENFTVIDSASFNAFRKNATQADIEPGSEEDYELLAANRVMYNIFASRDYYYGIVWLPSKNKFVRAWRN